MTGAGRVLNLPRIRAKSPDAVGVDRVATDRDPCSVSEDEHAVFPVVGDDVALARSRAPDAVIRARCNDARPRKSLDWPVSNRGAGPLAVGLNTDQVAEHLDALAGIDGDFIKYRSEHEVACLGRRPADYAVRAVGNVRCRLWSYLPDRRAED